MILGTARGMEAIMVLTLIFLKLRALRREGFIPKEMRVSEESCKQSMDLRWGQDSVGSCSYVVYSSAFGGWSPYPGFGTFWADVPGPPKYPKS